MSPYLRRSALILALGLATCATEHRGPPAPETAGVSGAVLITGKVELPPVHPMMLFPRRVRGREHIDSGMNQALDDKLCGFLDRRQPRQTYGLRDAARLRLSSLLAVRVVPWEGAGSAQAAEGVVSDDGSFTVEAPRSLSGYFLTVSGGAVRFEARIRPSMLRAGRVEGLRVGPASTALAELAETLGPSQRDSPDETLLQSLGPRVDELAAKIKDGLAYGLLATNFVVAQTTNKPYYVFKPCTDKNPDPACYRTGDDVPYALMSASDLPADAVRWRPDGREQAVADQYAAQGLRVAPWAPAGVALDAASQSVSERPEGYLLVQPPGERGGVDLVFDAGVHAVGMTIQNGPTHADTRGESPRRAFRFIVMDRHGAPIEEYHWYTNQGGGGPGFYGVASEVPIYRIRIEVRTPGPLTVGDLSWSGSFPQAVADGLGWTATGNWRLEQDGPENRDFYHPYYKGYEEDFGDQFYNPRDLINDSSKGRYWHVGYGPTADPQGSTLASPAFTLNNLDLDPEDASGFGWWISGVTSQTQAVGLTMVGVDKKIYRYETTGNPTCRIGGIDYLFDQAPFPKPTLMPGCTEHGWDGHYVGGMDTHWGHFHFRADIDVPEAAQWVNITSGPDRTERYVEYSTDNGATWRPVYWWPDQSHHGVNDVWWKNHGHGLYDSDMVGRDWNGNGQRGTDFDKDGVDDYVAPLDNNGNGIVDADPHGDDAREWDTEWYMEYVPPDQWKDVDGDGYVDPDIEGVSVRYRLRFVGPATPAKCGSEACFGWKIDDFAINNDNPRVGYYTSFDGSYDANLRAVPR